MPKRLKIKITLNENFIYTFNSEKKLVTLYDINQPGDKDDIFYEVEGTLAQIFIDLIENEMEFEKATMGLSEENIKKVSSFFFKLRDLNVLTY